MADKHDTREFKEKLCKLFSVAFFGAEVDCTRDGGARILQESTNLMEIVSVSSDSRSGEGKILVNYNVVNDPTLVSDEVITLIKNPIMRRDKLVDEASGSTDSEILALVGLSSSPTSSPTTNPPTTAPTDDEVAGAEQNENEETERIITIVSISVGGTLFLVLVLAIVAIVMNNQKKERQRRKRYRQKYLRERKKRRSSSALSSHYMMGKDLPNPDSTQYRRTSYNGGRITLNPNDHYQETEPVEVQGYYEEFYPPNSSHPTYGATQLAVPAHQPRLPEPNSY